MAQWQIAQLNIAQGKTSIDSPEMEDFVAQLDEVNALAERTPGFIWRLQSESGNATDVEHPFGTNTIVNMSVWDSVQSLHQYVYRTAHSNVMARRKEWFERMSEAYTVLWWIPAGQRPTVAEGKRRLDLLKANGPTQEAFSFKHSFPDPGVATAKTEFFDDECPAY